VKIAHVFLQQAGQGTVLHAYGVHQKTSMTTAGLAKGFAIIGIIM
jgi:hypothetical protein